MTRPQRCFLSLLIFLFSSGIASAQIGLISGPASSPLACTTSSASFPELRPGGYTELVGEIVVTCTGGPVLKLGAAVPTTNVVVYLSPAAPITSRFMGSSPSGKNGAFVSEALLLIDEPGANITAGAPGYGPQAPQTLCTSTQQQSQGGAVCQAFVGAAPGRDITGTPASYPVAVTAPNGVIPAANIYQGEVGALGPNSVTFYNVPVLPPAYAGLARTFRITNVRASIPGGNLKDLLQATVATFPNLSVMPLSPNSVDIGLLVQATWTSVNSAPVGGGNSCGQHSSPALSSQITFNENTLADFRTRVAPGGVSNRIPGNNTANTLWAAEGQNLASPANQNIPGGLFGEYNESGFILPAATYTDAVTQVTYTAGLADFGTRLKAVFANIPLGVTVYVSTTSTTSVAIPGGTSLTPYAVLVAASQPDEARNDGAAFAPLSSTIAGSDGLFAYPLTADNSGVTAAVWEVVNSNPLALGSLTFSVYLGCEVPAQVSPPSVALTYAPEPGGGTFSPTQTGGLTTPLPRFAALQSQGNSPCVNNGCKISINNSPPLFYSVGGQVPSQIVPVTIIPSLLPVTVTPIVTTPPGGNWLSAALYDPYILEENINPAGLAPSSTPYTGKVQISAQGVSAVTDVSLTVYPQAKVGITMSHSGNFVQGEQGAAYSIRVSNDPSVGPTSATVFVTDNPPAGESILSMTGDPNVWTCLNNTCYTEQQVAGGGSYPPITVSMSVATNAASSLTNAATVSGGGAAASATATDVTTVVPFTCTFTGNATPAVADIQMIVNEALGVYSPRFDLNRDGIVNIADIEVVLRSMLSSSCIG